MNTRSLLLLALIVLPLLCLGWMHYCASAELAAAPHITVEAISRGKAVIPAQDISRHPGCNCRVEYALDPYSFQSYLAARRKFGDSQLHLTIEIAMRENRPHMATNLFVNGVPIADAVPLMNRGELPQAAE